MFGGSTPSPGVISVFADLPGHGERRWGGSEEEALLLSGLSPVWGSLAVGLHAGSTQQNLSNEPQEPLPRQASIEF